MGILAVPWDKLEPEDVVLLEMIVWCKRQGEPCFHVRNTVFWWAEVTPKLVARGDLRFDGEMYHLNIEALCVEQQNLVLTGDPDAKPKRRASRATAPAKAQNPGSIKECVEFMQSIGGSIDMGEKMYWHYESIGWCLNTGRPLKDWHAAAHKWLLNSVGRFQQTAQGQPTAPAPTQAYVDKVAEARRIDEEARRTGKQVVIRRGE